MLPDIHDETRGKWRGILSHFGLSQANLSGKHGPCPICQDGKDRFRFDDLDGRGTWICNSCGAGTGFDLVIKLRGLEGFREAVTAVRGVAGRTRAEAPKKGLTDAERRQYRLDLWRGAQPVQKGDPVDVYLTARNVGRAGYWPCLRYHPAARYSSGVTFPAMLAAVQGPEGQGVSIHRTFLKDGAKAPVDQPRMMMPGAIPPGSAVRMGEIAAHMGIAEGIETALAASYNSGLPVWSALTATLLAEWTPPRDVQAVTIFGDNDANFTGQAAAYRLARRLAVAGLQVKVEIPEQVGTDWADWAE